MSEHDEHRAPEDRQTPDRDRGRLVNWGELLATCLASALATLVLSRLGAAGTVVGAAVTPLIITLTTTALSNEAGRARRLARGDGRRLSLDPQRRRRLTAALTTAGAATCVLVAGIAFAEAVTDERVSDWGRDGGASSRPGEQAPAQQSPTPTETRPDGQDPSPSPTASVSTPTATPTEPAAPTPMPTAPSASPTAAPSPAAGP